MSVWKDIRCDINADDDCYDQTNHNAQGFESAAWLRAQARKAGWERVNRLDVCPACVGKARP